MRYYEFSVAVGGSQRHQVAGNFVAYHKNTAGAAAPAIAVKTNRGHEVILLPGETVRFPEIQAEILITNYYAANTISGIVMVGNGDFYSNRIDGEVSVTLIEQGDTITNVAEKTIGTTEGAVAAASASRRSLRVFAPAANTDDIYLGATGITTSNGCVKVAPGQSWTESDGAAAAWYAISGSAGQKLRVQEIS